MKVTNWRGLAPSSTYQRSLDGFFNERYRSLLDMDNDFSPPVNTQAAVDSYIIEVAAPGFRKADFDITVKDGLLTISSEHCAENEENNNGYINREFICNSFSRSLSLPKDVDDEHISANYVDGILRINIPRELIAEENEAKRTVPVR